MAKITKSLSSRAGLDGKHQVLLLVYIAKTNRFRLKSPIYLSPDLFDIDAGEIIIPNRYQASPTRLQEITQIKVSLDAYINRIQSILSVARPEHATNCNEWKERPLVTFTYFALDTLKKGGSYKTLTGIVQKVDDYTRTLTLEGGAKVEIVHIIDID